MSITNGDTIKINNQLIIKFIKGKKYMFYRGQIVHTTEEKQKINGK